MKVTHHHTTTDKLPEFSKTVSERVATIISRYPEGKEKSALIPILHLAQDEFGGWLSPQSMDYVADLLKLRPVEVYEVASFYSMFNLRPVGHYVLEVCQTGPCCLNGADDIIQYLKDKLQISSGETTTDGMFTLKTVECLASCGSAPMMQIGKKYHENLTPSSIDLLLSELRAKHTNA